MHAYYYDIRARRQGVYLFALFREENRGRDKSLKLPPSAILVDAGQEISEIYSFLILMFGSHLWLPKHEPGEDEWEKWNSDPGGDEDIIKCQ